MSNKKSKNISEEYLINDIDINKDDNKMEEETYNEGQIEITRIGKTPFTIIKEEGKETIKLTIGNYVVYEGKEEEARKKVREKDWSIILGMVAIAVNMELDKININNRKK